MSTLPDRHDELLQRDWSEVWESLPEAPALVPRQTRMRRFLARVRRTAQRLAVRRL